MDASEMIKVVTAEFYSQLIVAAMHSHPPLWWKQQNLGVLDQSHRDSVKGFAFKALSPRGVATLTKPELAWGGASEAQKRPQKACHDLSLAT